MRKNVSKCCLDAVVDIPQKSKLLKSCSENYALLYKSHF